MSASTVAVSAPCRASSPARIAGMNRSIWLEEMAYPNPTLKRPRVLTEMRPLTPITSPAALNNGPPEFPGFTDASTWMQSE